MKRKKSGVSLQMLNRKPISMPLILNLPFRSFRIWRLDSVDARTTYYAAASKQVLQMQLRDALQSIECKT
jgi:hypothetical protein